MLKRKVLGMAISQHPFLERSQLANFQFVIAKVVVSKTLV